MATRIQCDVCDTILDPSQESSVRNYLLRVYDNHLDSKGNNNSNIMTTVCLSCKEKLHIPGTAGYDVLTIWLRSVATRVDLLDSYREENKELKKKIRDLEGEAAIP